MPLPDAALAAALTIADGHSHAEVIATTGTGAAPPNKASPGCI